MKATGIVRRIGVKIGFWAVFQNKTTYIDFCERSLKKIALLLLSKVIIIIGINILTKVITF